MEPGIEVVSPNLPEHNLQDSHKEHYSSIHPDDRPTNVLPASSAIELRRPRQNIGVLLLVALVTAIVVGAAVGGGLGSQLKQARDHAATECPISNSVSTRTVLTSASAETASDGRLKAYTPAQPADISTLALECPGREGEVYCTGYFYTVASQRFAISCPNGWAGGDIVATVTYTFNDCMEACAAMNTYQGVNICKKVVFEAVMEYESSIRPFTCFLKTENATVAGHTADDLYARGLAASASLVGAC